MCIDYGDCQGVTLGVILQFATGSDSVPPLSFRDWLTKLTN